jgi:glycosyltransferase involved in cell wall biosynthesis
MYNEERGAEKCLRSIDAALRPFGDRGGLIVVDDGSRDATREIIVRVAAELTNTRVVLRPENGGYGAALRTGAEAAGEANADYVLFMDSDLTNDPSDIPRFVAKMGAGADVIKATRFRGGGGMRGVPQQRARISHLGNVVASLLFRNGLSDCTNGFRAVRTDLLLAMKLQERGFAVIVEELWWNTMQGATFSEIPVILTSRDDDLRPSVFTYNVTVFSTYLKYALRSFRKVQPT